jgi:ribonuclease T1
MIAAAVVIVALLAVLGFDRCSSGPVGGPTPATSSHTPRSGLPAIAVGALPAQARSVLELIDRGGPYPYAQDNTVFSNNEGRLPKRPAGYYREYTVVTPGAPTRGTRRLIVGRAGDIYYTSDHYDTFRQVIR